VQNAVKMTRSARGTDQAKAVSMKTAAQQKQNNSDVSGTMDRFYNQMVVTRKQFLGAQNKGKVELAATGNNSSQPTIQTASFAPAIPAERDPGIALTGKDGMSLENYMRSLHTTKYVQKRHIVKKC